MGYEVYHGLGAATLPFDICTTTKRMLEYNGGLIAISTRFDKLITSLRTAMENGEGLLDKEATSYDDIFDAFGMSPVLLKIYTEVD